MNPTSLIQVWRYAEAPAEIRAQLKGGLEPQWLILMPPNLAREDVESELLKLVREPAEWSRFELDSGHVLFMGWTVSVPVAKQPRGEAKALRARAQGRS